MPAHIDRARLGPLTKLASGGQGVVYAAPRLRMQYASSLAFKQYRPELLRVLDVGTLDSMPAYLESLPFAEGMALLSKAAWPCRLVDDGGAVTGFVMPAIPDPFYLQMRKSSGISRELGEFQHLLNDDSFLARRNIPVSDRRRYELLGEVARALSVFHQHGIAVGDLSPKNLLFAHDQTVSVYFIDCDAMRFQGRSVMPQLETPGWEVRHVNRYEELGTVASDSYKLGLLTLRLLTGTQDTRDPGRLPSAMPSAVRDLVINALSAHPGRRPRPTEWIAPLAIAAASASVRTPTAVTTTLPVTPGLTAPGFVQTRFTPRGTGQPTMPWPTQRLTPAPPANAGRHAGRPGGPTPAPMAAPAAVPALTDVGLRRDVGRVGLLMSSAGSIIGAGWLFGAVYAAEIAGSAAMLSWIIAGVAALILALVYAELGGMYPVAGGPGRYPRHAFGNVAGASFGWFSWLQAAAVAPVEVVATENYASYWWHGLVNQGTGVLTGAGYVVAIMLMGSFTLINFIGVRWFAAANSALTWWKLAIPALVVVVLLTRMHGGNFGVGGYMPYGAKGVLSAVGSGGVMFAYLGFEQAGQFAGEARRPERDIPWAIIGSVIISIILYVLLQVVFIGAMPNSQIAHGIAAVNSNAIISDGFTGLMGLVGLGSLALLLRVNAVISPAGTGLTYAGASARASYGLARSGYVPSAFARANQRGVPSVSLVVAFALGLLFMLPSPRWSNVVGAVTSASALMYAGAPLALGSFRRQNPSQRRPYRMPAANVLAPVAFTIANLIIYWSGWDVVWHLGIAIITGYVVIGLTWMFSKTQRQSRLDWKQAQWIPVYLIGLGIISRLGAFGGTNTIVLGWDVVVVTIFSFVIYGWAMLARP